MVTNRFDGSRKDSLFFFFFWVDITVNTSHNRLKMKWQSFITTVCVLDCIQWPSLLPYYRHLRGYRFRYIHIYTYVLHIYICSMFILWLLHIVNYIVVLLISNVFITTIKFANGLNLAMAYGAHHMYAPSVVSFWICITQLKIIYTKKHIVAGEDRYANLSVSTTNIFFFPSANNLKYFQFEHNAYVRVR